MVAAKNEIEIADESTILRSYLLSIEKLIHSSLKKCINMGDSLILF